MTIKTIPMDADWKARLKPQLDNFLRSLSLEARNKYLLLKDRLLYIGGEEVCLTHDEDIDNILSHGELIKSTKSRIIKGAPCRCHTNAGLLYDSEPNRFRVATGWALSEDGLWRQHSWAIDLIALKEKRKYLIETTVKRLAYFGFTLTEKQCDQWVYNNCL